MGKGGMAGMLFQITELEKTPPLKQMPLELGLNNQHQTCKDLKEELSRKRKQGTGLRQEWSDIKHSGWSVWASHSSQSRGRFYSNRLGKRCWFQMGSKQWK